MSRAPHRARPQATRALALVGASLLLVVSGCTGEDPPASTTRSASPAAATSPPPISQPIIRTQDAGTVIDRTEIDALVGRLDGALDDADVRAMKAVAPDLDVAEWRRRLAGLARYPMVDLDFQFDETLDRQVNASGGPLRIDATVVLTHQIAQVDSRPAVQVYRFGLEKRNPQDALRITTIAGPDDPTSPAPWDLGGWRVLESDHVVLTATPQDLARARTTLPVIDRGVARAMRLIPPPVGVSKVFVALADPDSPLYADGRTSTTIRESVGFAKTIGYVDPQQAASTGRGAGPTAPYAGSRVVLHPTAFTSDSWLEGVALHETVHAMAGQWGSADPWPTEGLAQWAESGGVAGLRTDRRVRDLVTTGFPGFARTMRGTRATDYSVFHDPETQLQNYYGAGAVYGYLESRGGRRAVVRFARLAYTGSLATAIATVGERDEATLFRHVQRWVDTL